MHIYQSKFNELYDKQEERLPVLHKLLRIDCKSCEDIKINLLLDYTSTRWFVVLSIVLTQYYFLLENRVNDFPYLRDLALAQTQLYLAKDSKEITDSVLKYVELRRQLLLYMFSLDNNAE